MLKPTKARRVHILTDDGRDLTYEAPCVVTLHYPAGIAADVDEYFNDLNAMALAMVKTPTGESVLAISPGEDGNIPFDMQRDEE